MTVKEITKTVTNPPLPLGKPVQLELLSNEQAGALRAAISEFPEDEDAVWKVLGDTCELYSIVCVSAKLLACHSEHARLRVDVERLCSERDVARSEAELLRVFGGGNQGLEYALPWEDITRCGGGGNSCPGSNLCLRAFPGASGRNCFDCPDRETR